MHRTFRLKYTPSLLSVLSDTRFRSIMTITAGLTDMESKVNICQDIITYTFANPIDILTALNMAGSGGLIFQQRFTRVPKNTRLAVYGNSAAHSHLCRHWIRTQLDKGKQFYLFTEVSSCLGIYSLNDIFVRLLEYNS